MRPAKEKVTAVQQHAPAGQHRASHGASVMTRCPGPQSAMYRQSIYSAWPVFHYLNTRRKPAALLRAAVHGRKHGHAAGCFRPCGRQAPAYSLRAPVHWRQACACCSPHGRAGSPCMAPHLRRVQQVARGGAVRRVLVRPDHALREARTEQLRAGSRRRVHPVPGAGSALRIGLVIRPDLHWQVLNAFKPANACARSRRALRYSSPDSSQRVNKELYRTKHLVVCAFVGQLDSSLTRLQQGMCLRRSYPL